MSTSDLDEAQRDLEKKYRALIVAEKELAKQHDGTVDISYVNAVINAKKEWRNAEYLFYSLLNYLTTEKQK